MKVYMLNESQGVDEEVSGITAEVIEKVREELPAILGDRGGKTYRMSLHTDYEYTDETGNLRRIPVTAEVAMLVGTRRWLEGKDAVTVKDYEGGSKKLRIDTPFGTFADGDCEELVGMWYRAPQYQKGGEKKLHFCIRVCADEYKTGGIPALRSVVSHELMHVKTMIRERHNMQEKAWNKWRSGKMKGGTPSHTSHSDIIYGAYDHYDRFGSLRYFLAPTEMKSQVAEIYGGVYEMAKAALKEGRAVDNEWLRKAIWKTGIWRSFSDCAKWLKELDDSEIEDFMHGMRESMRKELAKMTGVSSAGDFRRYMAKNLEEQKKRLAKAAYKGYTDAIAEYKK